MNFFGTDGIRGTYGSTLTDETAFLLGKSLALLGGDCPIVFICRDTRLSGEKLFNALAQGVYSGGGNVINLGVLPTNAVGHFVRKMGGDVGVMITASHNPPCDNGLKVFDRYGVKLCTSKQLAVSKMMASLKNDFSPQGRVFEPVFYDVENIYCEDVHKAVNADLRGLFVALDCCYGASYRVARKIFVKSNAKVTAFCNRNCGKLINVDCGATNPDFLLSQMHNGEQLGFAFDGDADRLAVVENGRIVPSAKVFFAIAKALQMEGNLRNFAVCGTVLTNSGVESALNNLGIRLVRTDVGDANVFQAMVKHGLNFGGEESGHFMLSDLAIGSDAIINALFVAKIYRKYGSLWDFTKECQLVPTFSANLPLTEETAPLARPQNLENTAKRVRTLFPNCRLVLRKSGTENKVRAYAEGPNAKDAIDCVVATFSQKVNLPK